MEKQKLIYVESKALFSPSEVSDKAIVFIKDTKEIWTHGVYFSCSGTWVTPITLSLKGDTTGSVSIDGSGNASIATTTLRLSASSYPTDANNAASTAYHNISYYRVNSDTSNLFPVTNNANAILSLNVHDYSYTHLLGFSSDGNIYHRRRSAGTWGTSWKTILNSSNYTNFLDSVYLKKSGGTMTGILTLTTDSAYISDTISGSAIFGTVSTSNTFTGISGLETVFAGRLTNMVLRTSGDNLYHYNHSKSARYLILDTNNYSTYALPLSGGTMTGALNFANNTWNKVGDDAYMGDCNVAGMIGIKGSNAATPGFAMYNNSGTLLGKLYASDTSLYWSDAKILTASGTSKLFVMGDGSLYSDTVSYTTWTKTTTSGIAWFPIADITDLDLGTALFMVRAYAHSSIIFTVVRGLTNGNINVLAGGGNFNNDYAYIRGVRLIGNVVEIGLNAAATYVQVAIRVLLPTFTYSLRSSLVESTSTTTPYVQYDINSGGNPNFGIISSKFTGNLVGNADTASNISTVNPILALPFENNTIQVVSNPLGALAELLGTAAAITHALRFNWYNTAYEIGNVRGGASNSLGFGVTYGNNNLCLLVKTNGTYSPYGFIGSLSGNASTASKWKDARTITLTGDVTGSVTLDGSSNVTLTTATAGTGTTSFLKCLDKRNSYPALIVTSGGNIGAAFMSASKLGLSDGSYYDAIILRGYGDGSGGNENALLFSKNTSSVYHSQYAFGSTTTWGTIHKFLDSNNYSSYALPLSGGTMTGKLTMLSNSFANLPLIYRTDGAYLSGVRFLNTLGYLGAIGMNTESGSLLILDTSGTLYPILDSRNYNNYAAAKSHTHPWSDITSKPDFDQKFIYATSSTYYSYGTTEASGSSSTLTRTLFWRDNDRALIGMYVQHSVNIDYGFELASSYGADALIYRRKFNGTWETPQTVLTSSNYTNYTIGYAKSNLTSAGSVGVIKDGKLYYNSALLFARFAQHDNSGRYSYELIAELTNYGTGINTSYITYGISGFMWAHREGNGANSCSYSITAIVNVGPAILQNMLRVSATTNVLIPFVVKYNNKYYIALRKNNSSTTFYFMGFKHNLLTTTIIVDDASLIEEIQGPIAETSTSKYYYNNGTPQEYLHAGNYKNFYPIKLLYPRTLWGQSFDGSANVNGAINIVRDSSFTNNYNEGIRIQGTSALWAGIFLGTDGTAAGYIASLWNLSKTASDTFRISRGATSTSLLEILNSGNVGIGTSSPTEKLLVAGNAIIGTDSAHGNITIKSKNDSGVAYLHFDNGLYLAGEYWKGYIAVSGWGDITMRTEGNGLPGENLVIHGMMFKLPRIDMGDFAFRNGRDQDVARISTLGVIVAKAGFKVSGGTSSQFLKADGSLDSTSYLPTAGGTLGSSTASFTDLFIKSSTAKLRLTSFTNSTNYIQSGNSDFTGNANLNITGYYGSTGSNLHLNFTNIYCRGGSYTNIDSGNYSSYALPLSGGTLTGTLISRDIRPSANVSYSLGTSSYYYNYVYGKYFVKNGSSDSYVLLGGGGHKAVSDFAPNNVATLSSSGMGNSDLWTLVFEQSYPASHWYEPIAMFYVKGGTVGCGILCFYNYWNSATKLNAYEKEVWFFGAGKSETSATFGGTNRDINDYLRIYIDTANFKYYIYYNRYNDRDVKILELLFFESPDPLHSSFFTNSTTVVNLPTESSTLVRVPIKTTYNHDRTIKTSKSIYASSFYENSDIRLKENIQRIDLSDLTKLVDLVQFNFKDSDTKKYGVIAQLLELVGLQNLVYENDGKKAVDYISLLVLEIQRLRNEIGELKLEINKKS